MLMRLFLGLLIFATTGCGVERTLHLQVQNEEKKPISGANIVVFWPFYSDNSERRQLITNENGEISCGVQGPPGVCIRAPGYYTNRADVMLNPKLLDGSGHVIVLKKILHPVPMFMRELVVRMPQDAKFPEFDLELGDWLPPFGKGKIADISVSVLEKVPFPQEWDRSVSLVFLGDANGILRYPSVDHPGVDEGWFPREAPLEGYNKDLSYREFWHATDRGEAELKKKFPDYHWGSLNPNHELIRKNAKPDDNYIFRIRGETGKPESGWYGKIMGSITLTQDRMAFKYYLNPAGRSLEYNGTNLAKPAEK